MTIAVKPALLIVVTLASTVYAQLALKKQMLLAGALPESLSGKIGFLATNMFSFWVISAWVALFICGVSWMATLTMLDLSKAYPFMGLTFFLIPAFSALFFGEPLTLSKLLGAGIIVVGIIVATAFD